jgi:hypothetical protein
MASSFFQRLAEERIRQAQEAGEFDALPGRGKPLELDDLSGVPEDLRVGFLLLKNAGVLPPEAQLRKEIYTLRDLLKHVDDEGQSRELLKEIEARVVRLDLLNRRSLRFADVRFYGKRITRRLLNKTPRRP